MPTDRARELAVVAEAQDGVFTIENATAIGFNQDQIDFRVGASWTLLYDGIYRIAGAPPTWRAALRAAAYAGGTGAAISHRSAAAIHDLPGSRRDITELTCPRWRRTIHSGLVVHESRRLDQSEVELVDGIPVTRPERTILDLASRFPSANYLEFILQATRRKRLITRESTSQMFDRHTRRGLKGVRALREALERWDPETRPTESEMETKLLLALRCSGLPEPVVQHDVFDPAGRFVARTDAAFPDARIAIEYDSKQEHSDEFQIARDAQRRNALQAAGYAVLSARHADLSNGGTELCDQIAAIMRRAAQPA